MRQILSMVVLSSLLLPLGVASAPIYKWIDEAGRTHYSNQPPQTEQNPETLEFEAVADDPAQRLAAQESLNDIVALAQQWEAARLERQRQRREERLRALETAYYERLLDEPATVDDELDQRRAPYVAYYPYYRPYPHPYRPRPHKHRRHQAGFSVSVGSTKGHHHAKHQPGRPAEPKGHRRPERSHSSNRRTPRSVGLTN